MENRNENSDVIRHVGDNHVKGEVTSVSSDYFHGEQEGHRDPRDSSDEYDSGSDLEEDFSPSVVVESPTLEQLYKTECAHFCVVPCRPFLRRISDDEIDISHYQVGPKGCKAIANVMKRNTKTTLMNISDNGIGCGGATALADLLKDNYFITVLDVSMNFIGVKGIEAICSMLEVNRYLQELSLAYNNIEDASTPFLARSLKCNSSLRVLNISNNRISDSMLLLGEAIKVNTGLFRLNLSGNSMRRCVLETLLESVKSNRTLRAIDLSFNGLDDYITEHLEALLKSNRALRELDIAHNRFTIASARRIAAGIEKNGGLRVFDIGYNSIQSGGAKMIVDGLVGSNSSVLEELYLDGIPVDDEFETSLSELFDDKLDIYVQFGTRIRGKEHRRRSKEKKVRVFVWFSCRLFHLISY